MNPDLLDELLIEPERYEFFESLPYQFDLARRDFFKVLGGGVLVVALVQEALAAEAEAQRGPQRGGGQRRPQEIGA